MRIDAYIHTYTKLLIVGRVDEDSIAAHSLTHFWRQCGRHSGDTGITVPKTFHTKGGGQQQRLHMLGFATTRWGFTYKIAHSCMSKSN